MSLTGPERCSEVPLCTRFLRQSRPNLTSMYLPFYRGHCLSQACLKRKVSVFNPVWRAITPFMTVFPQAELFSQQLGA